MGWFANISTKPVSCPSCGKEMDTIQTKGWDGDKEYFIKNGKPYEMGLNEAFDIASEITTGGGKVVYGINSCNDCKVYAEWTFYRNDLRKGE